MKIIFFILIFLISLNAGWDKGNTFVEYTKELKKDTSDKSVKWLQYGLAGGYVSGIRDMLIDAEYICIPKGVTTMQIDAIVLKYIDENPNKWHESASFLVWTPLIESYPCKKKK